MTREEAINQLQDAKDGYEEYLTAEAIDMAIQALSQEPCIYDLKNRYCPKLNEHGMLKYPLQEPCTDAISREAVLLFIEKVKESGIANYGSLLDIATEVRNLPSVTHKSGKWIDYRDDGFVECPYCGHATNCEDDIDELHYCFYCGASMVEPQESEDKE